MDGISLRIAYDVCGTTVFRETGSFSEASNFSARQEISRILWNQNFHYRAHKIYHFSDAVR